MLTSTRAQFQAPAGQFARSRNVACNALRPQPSLLPQHARAEEASQGLGSRLAAGVLGAAAALTLLASPPALAAEPFLKSTGAKGPLVAEEEQLFRLREQFEREARDELEKERFKYESEARNSKQDMLCATPFGVDVVGITEFIALTGALVGGLSARRRKEELERLNEQLRTINTQLRQQARAGTLYAPGLTYAPPTPAAGPSTSGGAAAAAVATRPAAPILLREPSPAAQEAAEEAAAKAAAKASTATAAPPAGLPAGVSYFSDAEDEMSPGAKQCLQALKEGKRFLKERNGGSAMVRFEKALMLAKSLGDKVKERRAVRGLAASCRMQGQGRQAIKHLERVLEISREMGDYVGDADAYGVIADIYTELGEFEKAADFYDKYISRMENSPV